MVQTKASQQKEKQEDERRLLKQIFSFDISFRKTHTYTSLNEMTFNVRFWLVSDVAWIEDHTPVCDVCSQTIVCFT